MLGDCRVQCDQSANRQIADDSKEERQEDGGPSARSPENENNRRTEEETEESLQLPPRGRVRASWTKPAWMGLDIPFHVQMPREKKHTRILGYRAARNDRPNEKRSRRGNRRRNVFRRQTQTQINDQDAGNETGRAGQMLGADVARRR